MKRNIYLLVLLLVTFTVQAQPPITKEWDARFGGSNGDGLISLQQTSDGGYILGGYSASGISGDKSQASQGSSDYWVVKISNTGVKQWDATFGGSNYEALTSLQQTSDGGYILGGYSHSGISGDKSQASQGNSDYWVVKISNTGVKQWDATFGGSNQEVLYSLQQTSDGGYILGGYSGSGISGDKTQLSQGAEDYWIVKISSTGVKQWDATFGGDDYDPLVSLQQTSDGGYILAGFSYSGISGDKGQASQGNSDYWVVKISNTGVKQWDATFGGSEDDELYSVRQTTDGGYILGGYSGSGVSGDKSQASQGEGDYWVVKINTMGVKQWDARFGGDDEDQLKSLEQTTDGGYLLGGDSGSGVSGDKSQASQGEWDYWVVKINTMGVKQWDARFGGDDMDRLMSLEQTTDGGYILGGFSYSGISGDKTQTSRGGEDYWIVKTTGVSVTWYLDADNDGWYISTQQSVLSPGAGWVGILPSGGSGDCNDNNASIHPGATEICGNSIDDNCNNQTDEGCVFTTIRYVDSTATGANNGTSWADAYITLAAALANAQNNTAIDSILVAKGTYYPTGIQSSANRDSAFAILRGNLKIYGGYPNGGGSRNIAANPSVLSGNIGTANNNSDNSCHVLVIAGITTDSVVVDGFTIKGGNALEAGDNTYNGQVIEQYYGGGICTQANTNGGKTAIRNCSISGNNGDSGGGMYNYESSPTIANCIFSGNDAFSNGGGIYNLESSSPTITNCTFSGNTAGGGGGGMCNSYLSSPVVSNCLFSGNNADAGGGISNEDNSTSSPTIITNCIFYANIAGGFGGGGILNFSALANITNCIFYANTAGSSGGGMYNASTSVALTNCTFYGNTVTSQSNGGGGGMVNAGSSVVITNTILWGNTSYINNGIFNYDISPTISYSLVQGITSGTGNLNGNTLDPLFVNFASGNFHLQSGSPCVNAGSNAAVPSGVTTDVEGNARIQGNAVDMGAYEFNSPLLVYYRDADGDGYGNPAHDTLAYAQPQGFVANNTDCDDNNINIHAPQLYYVDSDGDGFGSATTAMLCELTAPVGYATNNTDCDDNNINIHEPQLYYVDSDGDGFGSATTAMLCSLTAPAGYSTNSTDCNDNNGLIHAPQQYYVDTDGDGFGSVTTAMLCSLTAPAGYSTDSTDCDDNPASGGAGIHSPQQYYVDADGDGFGSATTAMLCELTAPVGYATNNTDCDDNNINIHEPQLYYVDTDEDGFGSATTAMLCELTAPVGYATNNTDCDDNPASGGAGIHSPQQYYVDADGDGFGSTTTAMLCELTAPVGYSTNNTDCDDNPASGGAGIHSPQQYYVDADGDGFGSATTAMLCELTAPVGYATNTTDCDDNNINIHEPQLYYVDVDGDGFGSATTAMLCELTAPVGYATNNTDCDDNNINIHEPQLYYVDTDGDGFGSVTTAMLCSLTAPAGYSTDSTDCDDNPASGGAGIHSPQQYYVDADGDGFGSTTTAMLCELTAPVGYATNNTDCDDNNINIHEPQLYYVDTDGDGFGSATTAMLCELTAPVGYATNTTDCDDNNINIHEPQLYYVDVDGDGFGSATTAMLCELTAPVGYSTNNTDCDDNPASGGAGIHSPQQYYVDADGDGFGSTTTAMLCELTAPVGYATNNTDCDDNNINIHPGATEICGNGIDDNCDNQVDEGCGIVCPPCTKAPKKPAITVSGTSASSGAANKFCSGDTIVVSVNVPDANACSYVWAAPAGGNIINGQGTSSVTIVLDNNFTANGTVSVYAQNPCGQTLPASKPVNAGKNIYKPGAIAQSGVAKICPGETRVFSVPSIPGISVYTWTPPAGTNILNGQGTTDLTLEFTTGFTATGPIQVVTENACGTSVIAKKNATYGTKPPAPSTIVGNNIGVCGATNIPYSTAGGGTGYVYNWFFDTPEASVSGGQGSASITADFTTSFSTGSLNVTAANGCGISSPRKLSSIKAIPAAPTVPAGLANVCFNQANVAYSIPVVTGSVNYTWIAPPQAIISDGIITSTSNTLITSNNAVTITFGTKKGAVKVMANNACGSSSVKMLNVNVTNCILPRIGEGEGYIQLFPNPAHEVMNVMFYSAKEGNYEVRVYDALGKVVLQQSAEAQKGSNQTELNVSHLAAGVYQLLLQSRTEAGAGISYKARFVVE